MFAVWVLVGFLVSVIYLVVMREIVKGDLSRIDSLCLVFSNRFRKGTRSSPFSTATGLNISSCLPAPSC